MITIHIISFCFMWVFVTFLIKESTWQYKLFISQFDTYYSGYRNKLRKKISWLFVSKISIFNNHRTTWITLTTFMRKHLKQGKEFCLPCNINHNIGISSSNISGPIKILACERSHIFTINYIHNETYFSRTEHLHFEILLPIYFIFKWYVYTSTANSLRYFIWTFSTIYTYSTLFQFEITFTLIMEIKM